MRPSKEKQIAERFQILKNQLEEICAQKGHEFSEESTEQRVLTGHRIETQYYTDCECFHRCSHERKPKSESVGIYTRIRIIRKHCKRCDFTTETRSTV